MVRGVWVVKEVCAYLKPQTFMVDGFVPWLTLTDPLGVMNGADGIIAPVYRGN